MFILKLFSRLPLGVLYLFSDVLFVLGYYVFPYRKKLVRKHLKDSFPEKTKTERRVIERKFYRNLCDYAVETLKLLTISREELFRRNIFTNPQIFDSYKEKNLPVIGLASHQFNWEWLLASGNFHFRLDFVYQPIKNKLMERVLLECRTRFGGHAIKRNELARDLIKQKNEWRIISIVSDQYPGQKKDKKYITQFLNQQTAFFEATNQIASLTQYPVAFAGIRKIKRGYYETTFTLLFEPPYQKNQEGVIDAYAKAAEEVIRENPDGWLWTHKRWKNRHITQASAKYPPASVVS
jgi:Kdo2-lipid IVA lauroyltransferase/acyltransferase